MADRPIALLDTPVLFSAPLRDTLCRASERDLFVPRWSVETLDELARNLAESGRMTESRSSRLIAALTSAFPKAAVTASPGLIAEMTNHPKDRHALAAAVATNANIIVTPNLRDFNDHALSPFGILALSPDDFLLQLLTVFPATMLEVIDHQSRDLRHPPLSRDQVLDSLAVVAPKFAELMREAAES